MKGIKTIFWDWNGTLLDDTEICRNIINALLLSRKLPLLSKNKYQDIFTFPVKNYYQEAGFDFSVEPFEKPADEFIARYNNDIHSANLHDDAKNILKFFRQKSVEQFVVSAMEQNALSKSIARFGIQNYFTEISGIDNHYASSKTDNTNKLIQGNSMNANEICLIGDTIHDHEVAQAIGCHCILVANGHQSKTRLFNTGRIVLDSLSELLNLF